MGRDDLGGGGIKVRRGSRHVVVSTSVPVLDELEVK